jgi:3-hydroxyacyl-[acyl-carrier-protein] dehydratase
VSELRDPSALGLPHRPPFLFLREVIALAPGVEGRASQVFPVEDPVFDGHFPGNPIVPGVLLGEAIAQLSGIVAGAADPSRKFYLTAIRLMKFPQPLRPGRAVEVEARVVADHGRLVQCEGRVRDGETVFAEGAIVLSQEA